MTVEQRVDLRRLLDFAPHCEVQTHQGPQLAVWIARLYCMPTRCLLATQLCCQPCRDRITQQAIVLVTGMRFPALAVCIRCGHGDVFPTRSSIPDFLAFEPITKEHTA